jgi:hypothetical protein
MSIYDDYSNSYTYPDATAASYQTPQIIGASTAPGEGVAASQPPTYYQAPSASAPPTGGIAGMVQGLANRIVGGINNHPLTLMSLGAGIAQGGIGRGLTLATAAAQAERNLQAQQVNHAHVFNALTGAGVPPDEALAAVLNPSLMRALAVKYLGPHAGGNAAGAAPAGAAVPAPGGAATYSPNAAHGASNNVSTAWSTQGQATGASSFPAVPTGVPTGSFYGNSGPISGERRLSGAPALQANAVPQTGTPQDSVTFPNPFDFRNTDLRSIILRNLWNRLWRDPRPLQGNPSFLETLDPGPEMLNPNPMGPPNRLIPPKAQ